MSILSNFYCPNIVLDAEYSFSESGDYKVNGDVSLPKFDSASLPLQGSFTVNICCFLTMKPTQHFKWLIIRFHCMIRAKRWKTSVQLIFLSKN